MKTNLNVDFLKTVKGQKANDILRQCVHCGFCNATCPTYLLSSNELDGPRGRIYLIKQMLEDNVVTKKTQHYLDRCLSCRNCESTCPSGVDYYQLLNIGRDYLAKKVTRKPSQKVFHYLLRKFLLNKFLFSFSLKAGQYFSPLLPHFLTKHFPKPVTKISPTLKTQSRKVLLVKGCVQPSLYPNIDLTAKAVFNQLKIECITPKATTCCGSLSHHLNAKDEALNIIKKNIDLWLPLIKKHQIQTITMTASGCGMAIKEYAPLLIDNPAYAEKARFISALYQDPIEIIQPHASTFIHKKHKNIKVAFHPPCSLQHGLKINQQIEAVLKNVGYTLCQIKDSHLCCGSAGTYSLTQPHISQQLLSNKILHLSANNPDVIATANVGCQLHLQSKSHVKVIHWLELLC